MGFSTEHGQLDRVFARLPLIAAQRKAVSIVESARTLPILKSRLLFGCRDRGE
jgi:hypothetical protein